MASNVHIPSPEEIKELYVRFVGGVLNTGTSTYFGAASGHAYQTTGSLGDLSSTLVSGVSTLSSLLQTFTVPGSPLSAKLDALGIFSDVFDLQTKVLQLGAALNDPSTPPIEIADKSIAIAEQSAAVVSDLLSLSPTPQTMAVALAIKYGALGVGAGARMLLPYIYSASESAVGTASAARLDDAISSALFSDGQTLNQALYGLHTTGAVTSEYADRANTIVGSTFSDCTLATDITTGNTYLSAISGGNLSYSFTVACERPSETVTTSKSKINSSYPEEIIVTARGEQPSLFNGVLSSVAKFLAPDEIKIEVKSPQGTKIIGGAAAIGAAYGSAIGGMFAAKKDFNTVESIAATSFLSAVGNALGTTIAATAVGNAVIISDVFTTTFGNAFKSSAVGSVTSLLISEFVSAMGIEGQGAQLLTITGSSLLMGYASVISSGSAVTFSNAVNAMTTTTTTTASGGTQFNAANIGSVVGTYVGTQLAQQVYQPQTTEGQIGASVGAAAAAWYVGAEYGATIGSIVPGLGTFIGAVIGAFVGYIAGGLIGDMFGSSGTPRSWADVVYDTDTNQFIVTNVRKKDGGSRDAARSLAQSAADIFNSLVQSVGGEVVDASDVVATFGMRNSRFTADGAGFDYRSFKEADRSIRFGVFRSLDNMQIAGGDVYIKRALYSSVDKILSGDVVYDKEAFQTLSGNLVVAGDYSRYVADPSVINALIASEPTSAFTAGWIITLQRADELGLNKRYVSDGFGGWEYQLREGGKVAVETSISGNESIYPQAINTTFNYDTTTNERIVTLNYQKYAGNESFSKTKVKDLVDGIARGTKTELQWSNQTNLNNDLKSVNTAAVINAAFLNDVINAGDLGNDVFGGAGNDTIHGGAMSDWIFGETHNDTLYSMAADALDTTADNNNYLDGGDGSDFLIGGNGSDWLVGGNGDDVLTANGGDDVLDGGTGNDSLSGGAGNDTYLVNRGDQGTVIEDKEDYFVSTVRADFMGLSGNKVWKNNIVGGTLVGGEDILELGVNSQGKVIQISDVLIKLNGSDLVLTITENIDSTVPADSITIKNWKTDFGRIEKLRFATGDEIDLGAFQSFILGTAADDILNGTNGRDFIEGFAGNDFITAQAGDDVAIGGLGNDFVSGDDGSDVVVGSQGNDNIFGGKGDDIVSGDNGDDVLRGGEGKDIITGGAGNDWIQTGRGDDVVRFGRGDNRDTLIDVTNVAAANIAYQNGQYKPGYGVYDDPANGVKGVMSDFLTFKTNVWMDSITGTIYYGEGTSALSTADLSFNDSLEFRMGVAPEDLRFQRSGQDLIIALENPADAETTFGNLQDNITIKDWYNSDNTGKSIENFAFYTYIGLQSANSNSITAFNFVGGDLNSANLDDYITGTAAQNWITGGIGNDTITGGSGRDVLNGNGGIDTLTGGSSNDVIMGGVGFDYASYLGAGAGVKVSLSDLSGASNTGDALNDELDSIEGLIGSIHADILIGDSSDNELRGNGANDGSDTLKGLGGDDVYVYNENNGIVVIQEGGFNSGGNDTLEFGASIGLADLELWQQFGTQDLYIRVKGNDAQKIIINNWFWNSAEQIENLQFANGRSIKISTMLQMGALTTGSDLLRGTNINGNAGDDYISGTSASDSLVAGVGNDVIDGGAGVDYIDGGAGIDTISYFGRTSAVLEQLSSTNASNADNVVNVENLDGTAYNDILIGDAQSNQLAGNDGNDQLSGVDGADTLLGQVGNDTLWGGNGDDNLSGGDDNDSLFGENGADVLSGDAGDDYLDGGSGFDNILGGLGNDKLYGQAGEDILDGGAGNDTLWGGALNDALSGGEGSDTLYGEDGNDLLINSSGIDLLDGGAGNDTYRINSTNSITGIAKELTANGSRDTVELLDGITIDQLWFTRPVGTNDLQIQVLGKAIGVALKGWYDADGSGIERIDTLSSRLNHDQVQTLVNAMAGIALPSSVDAVPASVQSIIHSTWLSKDSLPADLVSDITLRTAGTFAVREDAAIGTMVGKIDAFSPSRSTATYQYALVGSAQNQFSIDSNTGIITTLRNTFDAEAASQQPITVRVVNMADTTLMYEQSFVIGINDVNEKPVVDNQIFALFEYNASQDGNTDWNTDWGTKNGNVVGQLNATEPEGSALTYQIVSGNKGNAFSIDTNGQLIIKNAQFLDYETTPTWNLGVRVIDAAGVVSDVSTVRVNLGNIQNEAQRVATIGGNAASLTSGYSFTNYDSQNNYFSLPAASNSSIISNLQFNGVNVPGIYVETYRGSGGYLGNPYDMYLWDNVATNDGYFLQHLPEPVMSNPVITNGWSKSLFYSWGGALPSSWDSYYVLRSLTTPTAPNIAPTVVADQLSAITNTALAITKDQVLANDYDPDAANANTLVISSVNSTSSKGGTVSFNTTTQQITYNPAANFTGDDVVTYTIRDANNATVTGQIKITVAASTANTGTAIGDNFTGTTGADTYSGMGGADLLMGNDGNDSLSGGDGDDMVYGHDGSDVLRGDAGNDVLDGGTGVDTLIGGSGDDTYYVDNAADVLTENSAEGSDRIFSTVTYTLGANIELLTLTDAANINGFGNALNNVFIGNDGINTFSGGAGDDVYVIGAGDTVVENVNEGIDSVISGINYTLDANVENLYFSFLGVDTTAIVGTGNASNNVLSGNALVNILSGLGGDDTLDGAAGADTLIGGAGNDTYIVDNTGDVVTENAAEGTDTVDSTITYTLGADVENLMLSGTAAINGTGNSVANVITGNIAANKLNGAGGADTFYGGRGDDIYFVDSTDDVVSENVDEGADTIAAYLNYTLTGNVENLWLSSLFHTSTAMLGTGNELNNWIMGNAQANTLSGLVGDDTLDGGAGADTLLGGTGNDTYFVDNTGDFVIENASEGTDTINSTTTYFLNANIENLTLTGAAAVGVGNELNNIFKGNSAANTFIGGAGDDSYFIDVGDAIIEGSSAGRDAVFSSINYTLGADVEDLLLASFFHDSTAMLGTGNALNNWIVGNAQANTLSGLAGDDTLNGIAGADTLIGGMGNDTYYVDNTGDILTENVGEGADTVFSSIAFNLKVNTSNIENLTLTGRENLWGAGNDVNNVVIGNAGANMLAGYAGDDTLDGQGGGDGLIGGTGNDTYYVDAADQIYENLNEGYDVAYSADSFALHDNVEALTLTGTTTINGTGNALNNVITGNSAKNWIDGGAGVDTLIGGLGDDNYTVDSSSDIITEAASAGNDIVLSKADYTLSANIEALYLSLLYIGFNGPAKIATGNASNNYIYGNAQINTLSGLAGDDTLDGAAGADTLIGGTGNDTYYVDNTDDVITENASEGTDLVNSTVTYTLSANVENLTLTGTDVINGYGNSAANVIRGNTANNALNGNGGADTFYGGQGDDLYFVDSVDDVVSENANEGNDGVLSYINYTLGANVEGLSLSSIFHNSTAILGTGNTLNNYIFGNAQANTLSGLAGDDTLNGVAGNDVLDGGIGADTLLGDIGNDTYYVDNIGDVVTENAGEGTDTVNSAITYTLGADVEHLMLTGTDLINGTGNALNNVITGNSAKNWIDGGAGVDTLIGGLGDDNYTVDSSSDIITEAASAGNDIVLSKADYTLSANIEALYLSLLYIGFNGPAKIATGNASNNYIYGNAQINTLSGLAGDDTLDGAAGADTLIGGTGNDTYYVDNTDDVITENASEGTDLVNSTVTYTLSANVENLTLTGTDVINAYGNSAANVITGNSAANALNGNGGADTFYGGQGDDLYFVDSTSDVVNENANEGIDTIASYINYTLGVTLENLYLSSIFHNSTATIGTGNTLNNLIFGNAQANTLSGLAGDDTLDGVAGADTLFGGTGNDTYYVDNTGDVITENASEGTDLVNSAVTYTLSANVENLTLTGTNEIDGTGNSLINVMTGNSAANILNGNGGADTFYGGQGDDLYYVDSATDVVVENANEGNDGILSYINYTLGANVERLFFSSFTHDSTATIGIGNTLNNVLLGNAQANTLSGLAGDDTLNGMAGADTLIGGTGNDTYYIDNTGDVITENASEGTDTVSSAITYTLGANVENLTLTGSENLWGGGNDLNNLIIGNAGLNVLGGGNGNDTYQLYRGSNADVLSEVSGSDILQMGATIATNQLWFRHVGNNLEVSIIGTSDKATINSWYSGSANHIEQFKTSDGKVLLDTQVENLVSAMAAFSPPAAGQTTLPQNYQNSLNAVIAANWH
jgi:trimeric autotransporter adhesin